MSNRLPHRIIEWDVFSAFVRNHIKCYALPQYGDYPEDQVTAWSVQDCVTAIRKYTSRVGSNMRGTKESERDLLKIAHYACLAHTKQHIQERAQDKKEEGGDALA